MYLNSLLAQNLEISTHFWRKILSLAVPRTHKVMSGSILTYGPVGGAVKPSRMKQWNSGHNWEVSQWKVDQMIDFALVHDDLDHMIFYASEDGLRPPATIFYDFKNWFASRKHSLTRHSPLKTKEPPQKEQEQFLTSRLH